MLQDVVYFFAPEEAARVTISLCASSAFPDSFDTKLYVLADLLAPQGGQVSPVACNDDFCGSLSQITVHSTTHVFIYVHLAERASFRLHSSIKWSETGKVLLTERSQAQEGCRPE